MTNFDSLTNIGAVDGRYRSKVANLSEIVSEFGLMKYRVKVECEWLIHLGNMPEVTELPPFDAATISEIRNVYGNFDLSAAQAIKDFEATTNHDVKAVEYYVKSQLQSDALAAQIEWVHFGCTSEDINNTAYALMLAEARDAAISPLIEKVIEHLEHMANEYAELGMLSRTHGQTASPTTLGKEIKNVAARLQRQAQQYADAKILGKFNGAVGNFNAHLSAYPNIDWIAASEEFIVHLGLTNNPWTTQIEPHDYIAEMCHVLMRFNQVLLDFDRDMWSYISIDYFKQKKVEGETGSSTMPHKVNPIDFENSEGNLGIANALLEHLASKLPVSRWQRDLSDSTVLRNLGTALAHCSIAYQATLKGLSRLEVNAPVISHDLDSSWEVLAEPVQTVMRKYGMEEPYEKLKQATRGQAVTKASFAQMLEDLGLPAAALSELQTLTPDTYTGAAATLARRPLPKH